MAEAFVHHHGVTRPPVDVYELAPRVGIVSVTVGAISKDAILHALPADGLFAVILSIRTSPTRRRFSLAHEMGHRILHPSYGSHEQLDRVAARGDYTRLERAVNHFAACLLMPRPWFRERLDAGVPATELAREFDVSADAARRRMVELSR